ncbi:MAG: transporter substrate-binding domain-containing protein [Alphaproteobacteria bacterium]|nr:transporter substrate-binding domain-containing protein [Alphaproteobacteria bacterium]MBT4967091.1 transporter substrate-binding domain-containing protein [Alphaproteobacteria bacterium]MBT5161791.1 transporter substrate-binding domain-containing protein [Alphaproteobacteria bacterium]
MNTPIWLRMAAFVFLTFTFLSGAALADDTRAGEIGADGIRFATMKLVPYGYKNSAGENVGYLYDVSNAIMKEAGFKERNELLPVKRLHQQLVKGGADCTLVARIPVTEVYQLITPLGPSISLVFLPRSGIVLDTYEDLVGKRIAVAKGTLGALKEFAEDDRMKRYMTGGYRENMLMLRRGRVEAVMGAWGSLIYNHRELGYELKGLGKPLIIRQTPLWLVCSNHMKDAGKLERLRQATRRLRENGSIKTIISNYIGRTLESASNRTE